VIGSDSLLSEVELIQIYDDALTALRLPSFAITLNNRKVLAGLAELAGISDRMMEMTIAIDKLDKIGLDGVRKELTDRGFEGATVDRIIGFFDLPEGNEEKLNHLSSSLAGSVIGLKGVEELKWVLERVALNGLKNGRVEIDATLARGLNYYTGAILEVKADNVQMGSIGGGGRYDDLTGIFGLPGMSGVGISFGADRIYDVMSELNLFPESVGSTTRLLLVRFSESEEEEKTLLKLLHEVRQAGISTELYPDTAKLRKQFKYADDNRIPFTGIVGEDELKSGQITIKDMRSGTQQSIARTELIHFLTHS
jgi:histidyl-tRNA synthetase